MRLFIVAALLVIASALPAQNPGGIPWEDPPERRMTVKKPIKGEWMVGADGGLANFAQPEFRKKLSRLTGFVERNVFSWVGVQADINCGKGVANGGANAPASNLGVCLGSLSAVFPIPLSYALWPYIRVGGGYALWNENAVEGYWDTDDGSPAIVAAVGARYFPFGNERYALRLDIQRTETSLQNVNAGHWGFGVGLSVRIP